MKRWSIVFLVLALVACGTAEAGEGKTRVLSASDVDYLDEGVKLSASAEHRLLALVALSTVFRAIEKVDGRYAFHPEFAIIY